MLITHDLGVIAEMADEVVVMYAGKIIEKGTVSEIFKDPKHPYTIGLQKSKPLITSLSNEPLYSIPGQVPSPINLPNTCFFKNRCTKCIGKCNGLYPCEVKVSYTHYVSCYLYDEQGGSRNE
jgi:peptide/nickel transport system ATP-binding protein